MFDAYDRRSLRPSVVHIGPGVFHRAHQAVYSDALLRSGSSDGAIWGISLRSSGVRDGLVADDFVYHVVELSDTEGAGAAANVREIGAILGIDVASERVDAALSRLVEPTVTVVTITVTEHGYCAVEPGGALDTTRAEVTHDIAEPQSPTSLPGLLLEALVRRRAAGVAPFTVASCDNLPANGVAVGRVLCELAECRDPALATWVEANVAFPSSMVDRMVPATSDAERELCGSLGIVEPWPIVTEPFTQWVLTDTFPFGRPDWASVGVELVDDVHLHEQAKLRVLNAAHSALAYWGRLAGHDFIWQAVADPVLLAATREFIDQEAIPTLVEPRGWDLHQYGAAVLERFANHALPYTTAKVAGDGSQKLPVRLIPTIRELIATGRPAPRSAQLLAAWIATVAGPRAAEFDIADPALADGPAADLVSRACRGGVLPERVVAALLDLPGFVFHDRPDRAAFAALVVEEARFLWEHDVRSLLARAPASPPIGPNHREGAS